MAETYLLATLYLIYLPIAVHDAHFMMTMEGHALSPYTGPLTTLVLGGVLALRLARHTRQIERFNKTLTENVQRAELKLATHLVNNINSRLKMHDFKNEFIYLMTYMMV
jgi:hypothetical protein